MTSMTLRQLADKRNIFIGAAVSTDHLQNNKTYQDIIAKEFNMVAPENAMKWGAIRKEKDIFDFHEGDMLVVFAQENNMAIRGHTLVWHNSLPEWLTKETLTKEKATELLQEHITTVVDHYKGKLYAWDVVNEAWRGAGILQQSPWLEHIGEEYIELAFRWAHEADPDVKLFYNDWGIEGINIKSDRVYEMIKSLLEKDVPIHGIGIQGHVGLGNRNLCEPVPSPDSLSRNMQRFADLGLEIHITEMDVQIQGLTDIMEERLQEQAHVYEEFLEVGLSIPAFKALVQWGVTDNESWIPGYTGHDDAPLLFDKNYNKKPAYYGVEKVLENGQ